MGPLMRPVIIVDSLVWLLRLSPSGGRASMGIDSSADKRGTQSSGRKEQTTRHGEQPAPANSPVPGAFGKEGIDPDAEAARRSPPRRDNEDEPDA
jgi:hypothetical protein